MLITLWLLISLTGTPQYTIYGYDTKAECMKAKERQESVEDKMCIEFTYLTADNVHVTKDVRKFT